MLEYTKRQDKAFFLSRNAFIFPYVYHHGLLLFLLKLRGPKNKSIYDVASNSW